MNADYGNQVTVPLPEPASAPSPGSPSRGTLILIAGLLLLQFVALAGPDLFPEEAYYWLYARHLDLGYLDHPPIVAWLINLGTMVFGHGEFGVRFFAFVCHLVTCFFVFQLTALWFDRRAAWTAVAMLQVVPFFFMTGFIITPDAPLTACWAGALYFLARVFFQENGRAWLGVGICLGLGMLSKYTDRAARAGDVAFHGARCTVPPLVSPRRTLRCSAACRGHLHAGHHLERAARLGIIRLSRRGSGGGPATFLHA